MTAVAPLYLITGRHASALPFLDAVEAALRGGVRLVQLREKDLPARELLGLARSLRALTERYGARLLVNDRADLALLSGADGVHLPSDGLPADAARRLLGAGALIGVSTHSVDEAKRAEALGASFVTFGPVFATPSKARYGEPAGLGELERAVRAVSIPVYALGGIGVDNVEAVVQRGAGAAFISAVMGSPDPEASARALSERIIAAGERKGR